MFFIEEDSHELQDGQSWLSVGDLENVLLMEISKVLVPAFVLFHDVLDGRRCIKVLLLQTDNHAFVSHVRIVEDTGDLFGFLSLHDRFVILALVESFDVKLLV